MSGLTEQLGAALEGRYRIERELGRGGMATVFLAEDLRHRRRVAIKVLLPELAAALGAERFLREIEVAAGLNHPHILPLHESGEAGGLLYYVMPYVEGESLRKRLTREQQLPLDDALPIAREVADALNYAHSHDVVHRDIKPENILLSEGHAVVADFGIARAITVAGPSTLTATGMALGTPAYMSPEQAAGSRDLDGRSDLYSLGCVLYEMLAGQPPFNGPPESLAYQHLSVTPRPVTELRPATPPEVARALNRALAKTPADRFSTSAQFASALMGAAPATPLVQTTSLPAGTSPALPAARRRRWVALAATVAVAGALALVALRQPIAKLFQGRDATPAGAMRDWILVAEFDGPADDPGLAAAARELVMAGLDQSKVVAAVPSGQLKEALRLAGRPDTTRVDAAVARELAYRSAVRAVVEGHIGRLGRGYSIVLRVNDADDGNVLLSVSDAAKNNDELIPAFGRLTRKLRDRLGERGTDVKATRDHVAVVTPSFEAYRKFARAWTLQNDESDDRGSIVVCREALAIDPDFAAAWMLIGWAFNHLGQIDSSRAALEEALRRPERLTEPGRLFAEATVAQYKNDLPATLAAHDRLVREYPSPSAYANRGTVFGSMGRYEEALRDQERGIRLEAFVPRRWILSNQFEYLLLLGRLAEAEKVATRLKGSRGRLAPLELATAGSDWARAETCATALLSDPTADGDVRVRAAIAVAAEEAARGRVAASRRMLDQAQGIAAAGSPTSIRHEVQRAKLLLMVAGGGTPQRPDLATARDTSVAGLITQGWWAAVAGDVSRARQLLRRVRARPQAELARHGEGPVLLEAWIAAGSGEWEEAVRLLGPAARRGVELGYVTDGVGRVPMRWLIGEAWERLGRPDSAAAYLELALSAERMFWDERLPIRMVSPWAHCRLVLLYARMGRIEDARRHWEILRETVRTPDPEIQPLIAEARAALASAEGMARSARR